MRWKKPWSGTAQTATRSRAYTRRPTAPRSRTPWNTGTRCRPTLPPLPTNRGAARVSWSANWARTATTVAPRSWPRPLPTWALTWTSARCSRRPRDAHARRSKTTCTPGACPHWPPATKRWCRPSLPRSRRRGPTTSSCSSAGGFRGRTTIFCTPPVCMASTARARRFRSAHATCCARSKRRSRRRASNKHLPMKTQIILVDLENVSVFAHRLDESQIEAVFRGLMEQGYLSEDKEKLRYPESLDAWCDIAWRRIRPAPRHRKSQSPAGILAGAASRSGRCAADGAVAIHRQVFAPGVQRRAGGGQVDLDRGAGAVPDRPGPARGGAHHRPVEFRIGGLHAGRQDAHGKAVHARAGVYPPQPEQRHAGRRGRKDPRGHAGVLCGGLRHRHRRNRGRGPKRGGGGGHDGHAGADAVAQRRR